MGSTFSRKLAPRHWVVLIVVVIVLGGGLAAAYFAPHTERQAFVVSAPSDEKKEYWKDRIQDVGGNAAYKQFADAVEKEELSRQHAEAHFFGEALYFTEGAEGIRVCDREFLYGCYHAFVSRMLIEEGPAAREKLARICIALEDQAVFCMHGLGHGILAETGYDVEELGEALAICTELPAPPLGGCIGGVFMEYNMRTMISDLVDMREYSPETGLEPCTKLRPLYQDPCAFWQPQWWLRVFDPTYKNAEVYPRIREECAKLPGAHALTRCVQGVATIIASRSGWKPEVARTFCDRFTQDAYERVVCYTQAGRRMRDAAGKETALQMCTTLTRDDASRCVDGIERRFDPLDF